MTETLERNATAPAAKRDMPALSPQPPKLMDQVRDRLRVPPHLPVHVMPDSVTLRDENGEGNVTLSPAIDATEVDFVRYEGSYVLVQGK